MGGDGNDENRTMSAITNVVLHNDNGTTMAIMKLSK
jgi:hypothetical protein